MAKMEVLHLTPTQRGELHAYLRKRNLPASVAQRMRIVLLLDEGASYRDIEEKLGTPASTVSRWKQRYQEEGLLGLATIHPGQPPQKLTPQLRAKVLEKTRQAPPDGSTHWSLRKMAAVMKVSKNLIARIWKEADPVTEDANRILRWIRRQDGGRFTVRDCFCFHQAHFKKMDA